MRGMNGIELASALRERYPGIRVLMLSMFDNREYVLSAIRSGASGYVLKESPTEDIIAAISAVMAGGNYFSAQVAAMVAQVAPSASQLTSREHEILLLLAHGGSNKVVANKLDISVRTVETHRLSLRRKLGVDSASDLLKIAVNNGWTTL
jgi:two-component system, NarL family, nitrate/nitrite response regulator NarL